ncbi:DUF2380 domain-containing protein [Paracoccus ravus]|uniref:DUF2380 domain-containing protein n=1 Tax=Paracoccus ravus TaxID=2447760 RepID=UPI001430D862|nr:DUF2380 domain-containing protein [Paracoccus ravus]
MRAFLYVLVVALLPGPVLAAGPIVLPVKMLDTSNEATDQRQDHLRRQAAFAEALAGDLSGSLIAAEEIEAACPRETARCLLDLLAAKPTDRALFVTVQKTSTLILQVFADLVEVKSEKLVAHRELSFRGDNDESWARAARFLGRQLRALD